MNKQVIICIDDEPTILSSLEMEIRHLVGNECLIEFAENGPEALDLCAELLAEGHEIVLVISDCLMPIMKGDEVLKQIHILSPDTFKVMLTGQADLDSIRRAIQYANLYRYLSKPWQPEDLRLTIQEALQGYQQNKQLAKYTQELEHTNQALIDLNREKDEFLGIAAHDLKNPLSAILGLADMIATDFNDLSTEEIIEYANGISTSAKQMLDLIVNLLDVNRIETGSFNSSRRQVDILPIVQNLVKCHTRWAGAKNISLHLYHQSVPHLAIVDENTVHQILDNLVSNAIKYSPPHKLVKIRLFQDDHCIRCAIQDEGPGLSEQDQRQLFGKFTRLTPKPTGKEHSTGLGLFIVKKLADAMKGKIWCESELGKGSTFIIEFSRHSLG